MASWMLAAGWVVILIFDFDFDFEEVIMASWMLAPGWVVSHVRRIGPAEDYPDDELAI